MISVFLFSLILTGVAWLAAKLAVVSSIYFSTCAEEMLQRMISDTYLTLTMLVILWMLDIVLWPVTMFFTARCVFLVLTDWEGVAHNYDQIKRLM